MNKRKIIGIASGVVSFSLLLGITSYSENISKNQYHCAGIELFFEDSFNQDDFMAAGVELFFEESFLQNANPYIEVPETEELKDNWGYDNLGVANVSESLNIRKEPNTNSSIVGKLPKDSGCEIIQIENGWAKINSGFVEGYVSEEYLLTGVDAVAKAEEVAALTATVTAKNLKVRTEPNTQSQVLALIKNGAAYEIKDQKNGWVEITFDGKNSYLSEEYVEVSERLKTALTLTEEKYGVGVTNVGADLAQYASSFVGNPYVYGGTSLTKGADCSGFTLSVFKKYGVKLPHSARSQSNYGTSVSMDQLNAGDLVFYSKNGSIDHVAIYIGGGKVIHASTPKAGIIISKLNYRTPTCARRLI